MKTSPLIARSLRVLGRQWNQGGLVTVLLVAAVTLAAVTIIFDSSLASSEPSDINLHEKFAEVLQTNAAQSLLGRLEDLQKAGTMDEILDSLEARLRKLRQPRTEDSFEALRAKLQELQRANALNRLLPDLAPAARPTSSKEVKASIFGHEVVIYDDEKSTGIDHIVREMQQDTYGIQRLNLQPGDVVVDVGANVGMVSILIAKLYPFVKIYSLEPVKRTFDFLRWNLVSNNVTVVTAMNKGVTRDGRDIQIVYEAVNPGGNGIYKEEAKALGAKYETTTFDDVLVAFDVKRIALLKVDCEGCEQELLPLRDLSFVSRIIGENHGPQVPTSKHTELMSCLTKALAMGYGNFDCLNS